MPNTVLSREEIVRRGEAIYDQQIRPKVEAANRGEYLVLDLETGDYEIDTDHVAASDRVAAKHPGAPLFAMRIGYPTLARIGGRSTVVALP
ncbi:MAG: hypothetical protein HY321_22665 [Armatimonadetes bacterium]|nr:hypothetical protein [Armatimonadota bacterium]